MDITLGVDSHKDSHTIYAVNAVGRPLDQVTVANDSDGYESAYQWASQQATARRWGIENCGHFGRGLAQYLLGQGETVVEVSPHLTGRKRNRSRKAEKSDPNDALAIARIVLQEDDPLPAIQPEDETTKVKLLVEQRDNLVGERTRLLNQLHGHLHEIDPHYKENLGQLDQAKVLKRCKAYTLRGADAVSQIRITIIRQLATLILQLNTQIKALEKLLTPLVLILAPALLTIQGIKEITAAQLIACVGNIHTVPAASTLAHYAGIAPIKSGSAGNYYYRVNPKGNRRLNAVFHRIAKTQARCNPLAKAYLQKKKGEGKPHKQAFRCLKRRMVDIVYAVWKSGQPYAPPIPKFA
ncbi:MAG: IS110 family transposase [Chloroflexi bacterium]|nr:IS110 family transposase [Chloroflexota bacterium]